jgi:L-lactate dehydrogenase complex protein LldG
MEDSTTSKEKILKKVRAALIHKSRVETGDVDLESNIYNIPDDPYELIFAQNFTDAGGQFVFCENEEDFCYNIQALIGDGGFGNVWANETELVELLKKTSMKFSSEENALNEAQTTITRCEFLVARTGSVVISSRQLAGRKAGVYPDHHIVVAHTSQLVLHLRDALKEIRTKYKEAIPSQITFITGPSRTADIEKTLVQGAHGPKEVYLFLIDDLVLSQE